MGGKPTPAFGQGASGYGLYYAHSFADGTIENYMVEAIVPTAIKQDPRYYTLGHGGSFETCGIRRQPPAHHANGLRKSRLSMFPKLLEQAVPPGLAISIIPPSRVPGSKPINAGEANQFRMVPATWQKSFGPTSSPSYLSTTNTERSDFCAWRSGVRPGGGRCSLFLRARLFDDGG